MPLLLNTYAALAIRYYSHLIINFAYIFILSIVPEMCNAHSLSMISFEAKKSRFEKNKYNSFKIFIFKAKVLLKKKKFL